MPHNKRKYLEQLSKKAEKTETKADLRYKILQLEEQLRLKKEGRAEDRRKAATTTTSSMSKVNSFQSCQDKHV